MVRKFLPSPHSQDPLLLAPRSERNEKERTLETRLGKKKTRYLWK